MASIVLIAAFVGVYAGIFLASVYMVSTVERVGYSVAVSVPVERPAEKRQTATRPVSAIAVATRTRTLVPHV